MSKETVTPGQFVRTLRENMKSNHELHAAFSSEFLGKLNVEELRGILKGIEKEMKKREKDEIEKKVAFLESQGYSVAKRK